MRKIIASEFLSLDGVIEAPEKWHFQYFNDEMGAAVGASMSQADAMMMGRVLYQEWAAYWPTQSSENEVAPYMNNIPRYVVSTTLGNADEWSNTTLITGDVAEAIANLKQRPGKNISISGSGTLVRSLLQLDLLDELFLLVHPVIVGSGKRLFVDGSEMKRMTLVDSKIFSTGVVALTYQPAQEV